MQLSAGDDRAKKFAVTYARLAARHRASPALEVKVFLEFPTIRRGFYRVLGSGLIDHIQKMTIAAMAIADMKVWAQRS
jgi:hypothetical protein